MQLASDSDSDYDAYGAPSDEEPSGSGKRAPDPHVVRALSILEGRSGPGRLHRQPTQSRAVNDRVRLRRSATLGPGNDKSLQHTHATLMRSNTSRYHASDTHGISRAQIVQQRAFRPPGDTVDAMRRLNVHTVPIRIFLFDMNRYIVVNMPNSAVVIDVLNAAINKATLGPCEPFREWAIHDVLIDFALERPLRFYERISDVEQARGNDYGAFLLKSTEWGNLLHAQDIPLASAPIGGWVTLQTDPKTVSTRWLELREYSIYSARSEKVRGANQGKGEIRHCSMLDTELYFIGSQMHTKHYTFVLRTLKNGVRDMIYVSQSDAQAHRHWIKSITCAHSYVLRQERPELVAAVRDQTVREVRTRHISPARGAPLVSPESLEVQFEKGSLLANISR